MAPEDGRNVRNKLVTITFLFNSVVVVVVAVVACLFSRHRAVVHSIKGTVKLGLIRTLRLTKLFYRCSALNFIFMFSNFSTVFRILLGS